MVVSSELFPFNQNSPRSFIGITPKFPYLLLKYFYHRGKRIEVISLNISLIIHEQHWCTHGPGYDAQNDISVLMMKISTLLILILSAPIFYTGSGVSCSYLSLKLRSKRFQIQNEEGTWNVRK